MAEENFKPDTTTSASSDDMMVLNVLMHNVKGINGVSTAPAFEPQPDSF